MGSRGRDRGRVNVQSGRDVLVGGVFVAKLICVFLISLTGGSLLGQSHAALKVVSPVKDCADLQKETLAGVADRAVHVKSASVDGKYCRVLGTVEPAVEFEVRLPVSGWTQRYLQTGCGGLCGNLNVRVSNANGCEVAKNDEFALASTDMGHKGQGTDSWGGDPQKRIDFAYRGVHVTAQLAKALIAAYYGQMPKYSYFAGCSDGGREALVEAQRFPNDFDGITAGAPAMNFVTQNSFYHAWNATVNTGAQGRAILTADKLPILHAAALAACDPQDGLKDGLVSDPTVCHFDPAVTQCKEGQDTTTCLTREQVAVAAKLYQGAHDAVGNQFVIGGPLVGSELNWRGVYVPVTAVQPIFSGIISTDSIKGLIYAKPLPSSFTLADFAFTRQNFEEVSRNHELYDATNPNLGPFAARSGKLILWHGWGDPHISPLNTIAYYTALKTTLGGNKVDGFVRLFLFPGGGHCGGGQGPFEMDLLTAIMAWVESAAAPNVIIASQGASREGEQAKARTRPVYPYPAVATYKGQGSVDDAASFTSKQGPGVDPKKLEWLGSRFYVAP